LHHFANHSAWRCECSAAKTVESLKARLQDLKDLLVSWIIEKNVKALTNKQLKMNLKQKSLKMSERKACSVRSPRQIHEEIICLRVDLLALGLIHAGEWR